MQPFRYECKYITIQFLEWFILIQLRCFSLHNRVNNIEKYARSSWCGRKSQRHWEKDALKMGRKIINSPVSYKLLSILLNTFLIAFFFAFSLPAWACMKQQQKVHEFFNINKFWCLKREENESWHLNNIIRM